MDKYPEAIAYLQQKNSKDSAYLKEIAGMIEELRVKEISTERKSTSAQRLTMTLKNERGVVLSQMDCCIHSRYEPQMQ